MKKNEIIIVCGFVLISLIVGVILGYYWMPKGEKDDKFIKLDINNQVVQTLYKQANASVDYINYEEVYKGNGFSNEFLLGTAFVNYLKENKSEMGQQIPASDIEIYIKKIFGNLSFHHEGGFIISPELCRFIYHEDTSSYDYLVGCGYNQSYQILRKIVGARKSDDEYIITEKSIILYNTSNYDDNPFNLYVYDDVFKSKEITRFENVKASPQLKIEDYLDEAATYEYHFVFDGENFVYKSLEKV